MRQQRGAALILAMVVVTIVVLLANALTGDFLVTYKRVENQLLGKQAYAYMRGAEGIARKILVDDFNANTGKDHRSEGWLNNTVEFPMDHGAIAGTLCDLQARFNLNTLPARGASYSVDQQIFIRLLQTLDLDDPLDQQAAEDITNAVSDWIDSDSEISSTGGAEDGYYASLDLPMRTGNQLLQSITELRWVKGITADIYAALEPHIIALPVAAQINVNSADLSVLRAINETGVFQPLSPAAAGALLLERDGDSEGEVVQQNDGFDDIDDYRAAHPVPTIDTSRLAVTSNYFLLNTETYFAGRKFTLSSVLHRDSSGKITTLARANSGLGVCQASAG